MRDHYGDGAWYDAEYVHIGGDVAYYAEVASAYGPNVLELACGTGRITIPMAKTGARVVGVDLEGAMIAHAEQKAVQLTEELAHGQLEFVTADMRTVRLDRSFNTVVLAFNTLMHMTTDDDLHATLESARVHLPRGGHFFFDVYTPFPPLWERDPDGRHDPQEMIDPHSGARYIVTDNNVYDPRTQLNRMRFFYQKVDPTGAAVGDELTSELTLRVIFPRELDRWLSLAGFEVEADWDDFGRTKPFSALGGRRIVHARRVR